MVHAGCVFVAGFHLSRAVQTTLDRCGVVPMDRSQVRTAPGPQPQRGPLHGTDCGSGSPVARGGQSRVTGDSKLPTCQGHECLSSLCDGNACVNRLNLTLYSHPKEFWRNRVRTHVNSKGKSPVPEVQGRAILVTLHHAIQQAQHTTSWAIPAPHTLSPPNSFILTTVPPSLHSFHLWRGWTNTAFKRTV